MTLFSAGFLMPARLALQLADGLLARAAAQNAAAAVSVEASRRAGWRGEENEYLLLADPVPAAPRSA